ncbi:acyl-CoA N-acyltransferase [Cadophora sp. MPI-SDFR-AT-0126]|nr:acyl-CoA N-acyltransferase [Leotiomycetes sp. MPI-SDFR-AT-0126]
MTFLIEPASYADLDTLFDIYIEASASHPLSSFIYNGLTHDEKRNFESGGPKKVFLECPWVKYHKMVEVETGKIVAWSRWHFPRPLKDEEKGSMDPDYFEDIPAGANASLLQEWFDKLEEVESKYIDREKGFFINYLVVLPSYQRLGLGRRLLDIGLKEANALGASVFLVATEMGAGLYKKAGFKEIEQFVIDVKPWGGEGEVVFRSMKREPQAESPGK